MRHFAENKLIIASHNSGKVREIAELLSPFDIEAVGAGELGLPEPLETGDSFIANAELKARAAARAGGVVALADDSGLAVDALDGAPGIYSARWARGADGGHDFAFAMQKIHDALQKKSNFSRTAHFICALSLAWPDGHSENFEGQVEGALVWPPRGKNGFGYDPIFVPRGFTKTFGEMLPPEKTALSHRTRAFKKLVENCFVG